METQALQRIKKFSFPLNVYAYLLAMESGVGDVVNLHFGWFDNAAEPIAVAQERATRELLAWLPVPPARLLEVGAGVGTTLALLIERGYDARGITPDGSQIDFMRDRYGKDFPVEPVRFEDMALPAEKFDCILFQESGQYIPLEALFTRAAMLLRPGGQLIMCDEIMPGEAESGESLHSLVQLKSVAAEHGFALRHARDQLARAAPTVALMLAATSRYREDLRQLLEVSDEQIDALDESNRKYQSKYASGKYGYVSLCFSFAGAQADQAGSSQPGSETPGVFKDIKH